MIVDVNNVGKTYGSFEALSNISFKVNEGEVLGILGPNGAGKSTLIKILTSFHYPSKGSVSIFGKNIVSNSKEILKHVGYVPERLSIYPELSVTEYLNFIAEIKNAKDPKKEIARVMNLFKLDEVKHKLISELSKGFKQRVGIAGGVINRPRIIILDEPTSGLDPNQIIEFKEFLKELAKNTTILFSSHILSEVESICKRIIIVNNGKLVADDNKDNIIKKTINEIELDLTFFKRKGNEKDYFSKNNDLFNIINIEDNEKELNVLLKMLRNKNEEDMFNYIVSNNLIVKSMIPRYESLEDIFKKLTKGDI